MAGRQIRAKKLWGGRFAAPTDRAVERFTESVSFDRRLARHDIEGSIAHARMLGRAGILSRADSGRIVRGLKSIRRDVDTGRFAWRAELEDVHMNIESALVARIGAAGKKLHTARSRNDQVATDLRLWLREALDGVRAELRGLLRALLKVAAREAGTVMPGYTHLQSAQPITFGHHVLAWCAMLQRDDARLKDCRKRVNVLPLGAGALAGTGFPIDRRYAAKLLGFDGVAQNSVDAVSDRDFAIEFCAAAALIMMHLSRMSEELVLWMSPQFGFVELDDAYCTGSSIMPQKKNPDVPELVRGKTGRVYGDLHALLTLMKGQPLAYNRDNQEDKERLFDAADTVSACLGIFRGMIPGLRVRRAVLRAAAARGHATATDLADYLVGKGVAFRDAHEIVGRAVRHAERQGRDLSELPMAELRSFSPRIGADVQKRLTLEGSIAARRHEGGTAPDQVRRQAARLRKQLNEPLAG
jgi:argininosuccinate lyase